MQSGESIKRKRRSVWRRIVRFAPRWQRKRRWLKRSAVKLRWKDHNSPRRQWSDGFYEARHGVWPWLAMVVGGVCLLLLGLGLSAGFEDYFSRLLSGALIRSPVLSNSGIWTFLLALLAAPLAWYIWLIRDRNRLAEFSNTRLKELREYFYKLQEWATDSEHPSRQVTALFQLRDFLRGDRVLVPRELAGERRRFVRMAREFIVVLLRNRTLWESAEESDARSREGGDRAPGVVASDEKETESAEAASNPVRHPVQIALETIVCEDGHLLRDLSWTDLTGFRLPGMNSPGIKLVGVKLRRAFIKNWNISDADLFHCDFRNAALFGVNFSRVTLRNVDLRNTFIFNANLQDAQVWPAKFSGAEIFQSHLDGARISDSYRASIDRSEYTGIPVWLNHETGEPLDPQPDAESPQ